MQTTGIQRLTRRWTFRPTAPDRRPLAPAAPFCTIFLIALVFFFPVLYQGKTFYAFDTLLGYLPWSASFPDPSVHNPLITDPVNVSYPFYDVFKKSVSTGTLPLWDPYNLGGVPFASGFIPLSNPIVFLAHLTLSLAAAQNFVLFVYLAGAGIGICLYLRKIGLTRWAALVGGVTWMFNGYVMVWFEFQNTLIIACALPLSLYFIEAWLTTRSRFHTLCLAGSVAIAISSGFAHLIIYAILFIAVYFFFRFAAAGRADATGWSFGRRDLVNLGIAMVLGVLVSANFATTYLSFLDDPQRNTLAFADLYQRTGQVPVKYLVTLIFPDYFGSPALDFPVFTPRIRGAQPYNNYNELCLYAGVATLFLALVCLPHLFRRRLIPFYLIAALLTLGMAMGSVLYYPFARFVPGLGYSTPTRILFLFGFCLSVLGAVGLDLLITEKAPRRRAVVALWSLLLLTACAVFAWSQTESGLRWVTGSVSWTPGSPLHRLLLEQFRPFSSILWPPLLRVLAAYGCLMFVLFATNRRSKILFTVLVLALITTDLMDFGWQYNTAAPRTYEYPQTPAIERLKQDKTPFRILTAGPFLNNSLKPLGIEDTGGYHSFYPKRYGEYLHLAQFGPDAPIPHQFSRWVGIRKFGSPLIDLLNVRYLLVPAEATLVHPMLACIYRGEIAIYKNAGAFPRSFFVPSYRFADSRRSAYAALAAFTTKDFSERVVLEDRPPEGWAELSSTGTGGGKAVVRSYRPNRVRIAVECRQRGFVVLGDNYHVGWQARVDGKPAPLLRANYVMRAVPVPAGQHDIQMVFRPKGLIAGIFMTAAGWAALAVLLWLYGPIRSKTTGRKSGRP